MKCRHCGAELEKGTTYCGKCQKNNIVKWQMIVAMVASVILLAALAVLLFFGLDLDFMKSKKKATDPLLQTEPTTPVANYQNSVDYTSDSQDQIDASSENAVLTIKDKSLCNRVLQYYYNLQVYNFINSNQSYLTEMGLDYTQPLNNQKCYYQDTSWEEFFIQEAIDTWRQYQLVYFLAKEAGFKVSEETQKSLDAIPENLAKEAEANGYADSVAWLKACLYADLTVEEYIEYCTLISYYTEYIMIEPTAAELAEYYEEYESYFVENGVSKTDGNMVDVRHILVMPEGGTTDENNVTTYSDEEWAACKEKADALYAEWKSGKATEESFAEMANTHSKDGGSNTNGGLYTGITKTTQFVEPFLNWSIDTSRRVGDTGIVKTDYGYHIMYFSGSQPLWEYYAKTWYPQDRELTLVEEADKKWPAEVNYDAICIEEFSMVQK